MKPVTTTKENKMPNLTINAKHPVRAAIAGLPDYYDRIVDAFEAVETILAVHGMDLNLTDMPYFTAPEGGSWLAPIVSLEPVVSVSGKPTVCDGYDNGVNFSWYKLPSGRWEVITYVS
jgi:hypothetical protein